MLTTYEADYICEHSFYTPSKWERNAKGNLWRRYQGKLLTIFKQGKWYSWCINAGPKAVTFSPRSYRTEGEALRSLYVSTHQGKE
jgi:hypothetical protein